MSLVKCQKCKKKYVPEILLSTVEPPAELGVVGQSAFVEAHVCRAKKRKDGESNATIVSDAIPFVEYDLHRQLMYKLKIHGLNAVFGLRFQLSVGDSLIVAVACGTAMYLSALPTPPALRISRNLDVIDEEDKKLLEIQRKIMDLSETNRQNLEAAISRELEDGEPGAVMSPIDGTIPTQIEDDSSGSSSDSEDEAEKDNYQTNVVIQIDDDADEDLMAVLLDPVFTDGFLLCSTETLPNHPYFVSADPTIPDNAHLITTVKQGHINMISHHPNRQLAALFRSIYEDLRFRLSYFTDCVLAGITYNIQIPRANEVQIQLTAVALGQQHLVDAQQPLGVPITLSPWRSTAGSVAVSAGHSRSGSDNGLGESGVSPVASRTIAAEESMVFQMDECQLGDTARQAAPSSTIVNPSSRPNAAVSLSKHGGTGLTPITASTTPTLEHLCQMPVTDSRSQNSTTTVSPTLSPSQAPPSFLAHQPPSDGGNNSEIAVGTGAMMPRPQINHARQPSISSTLSRHLPADEAGRTALLPMMPMDRPFIEMTPLSFIPGRTPTRYLGKLSLHFVKETHILHDATVSSGMGGFVHVFLMEIQAVARSHVAALGGDAIVGLRVDESFFQESVKNQGYALISISGDVVGCTLAGESSNSSASDTENESGSESDAESDVESDTSRPTKAGPANAAMGTPAMSGWQTQSVESIDIPSSTLPQSE